VNLFAPIHVLSAGLQRREFSARELVDAYLARIRNLDPKLHAYAEVFEEAARRRAERADESLRAGRARSALHGIPIAYKDLLQVEGTIARGGAVGCDAISSVTSTAVQRLDAAGMIALGKTHMVEYAYGSWGTNTQAGTPWNPWDLATHRVPGGSSSGSGVAVGAALAPAALGSDTGGSIRIPASLCGVVGLKATVGRISNFGVMMLSDTLDTLGPIARDVEDAALLFDAMHGPDPLDPATLAHPRVDVLSGLREGISGMRFATLPEKELGAVEPAVMRGFGAALDVLRSLGARIETMTLPGDYAALADAVGKIISAEGYEKTQQRVDTNVPPMDEDVRARLATGKHIAALEYIRVLAARRRLKIEFAECLRDFDALLTPTTPLSAIPVADADQRHAPMSRLTRPANLLDLCALAVPCGFTEQGLPLSLQIIGRGYDEARVLRIGWAYERATDWHTRTPPL